jgi:hypothetical protein
MKPLKSAMLLAMSLVVGALMILEGVHRIADARFTLGMAAWTMTATSPTQVSPEVRSANAAEMTRSARVGAVIGALLILGGALYAANLLDVRRYFAPVAVVMLLYGGWLVSANGGFAIMASLQRGDLTEMAETLSMRNYWVSQSQEVMVGVGFIVAAGLGIVCGIASDP